MKIGFKSEVVIAYSQCPRKAFLLLNKENSTPNEYVQIIEQGRRIVERKYINALKEKSSGVRLYSANNLKEKSRYLIHATLQAGGLEAYCSILTLVKGSSLLGRSSYEPTIFAGTYRISKEQRLELAFVAHVLAQWQEKISLQGSIIGADEKAHKVNLERSSELITPMLESLQELKQKTSSDPPPVILNKHCPYCQFQALCKKKAEQEDHLSLLDKVTPKVVRQYEKKGIFTVKQLAYLFKPRKRKKNSRKSPLVSHNIELQALAIRENKIYIQELPELNRQPVELFLDIEGIPDQRFYYLFGLLVCRGEAFVYYPFWVDTTQDEERAWKHFITEIHQYPEARIYHYGSYEQKAIAKLTVRYKTDGERIKNRLVNVNNYIYGKVYFPVRSNSLKEIGRFIGAKWSSPDASGLQSLVWRHHWEETQNKAYKQMLLSYNVDDCRALKLLVDELSKIKNSANALVEIDFADQFKERTTDVGQLIHSQFKAMLKSSYFDYDKKKISFRQNDKQENSTCKKRTNGFKRGYQGQRKRRPRATKTVQLPSAKKCPVCGYKPFPPIEHVSKRLIIDIVSTKNGLRKVITQYIGTHGWCARCGRSHAPPDIRQYPSNLLYGHGLKAFLIYQRVTLRLPYESITGMMDELFGEEIHYGSFGDFIRDFASYYTKTEEMIIQRMLKSSFIHADETTINIMGTGQYIWVFTDGNNVVFRLRETREANIVHEFLADYNGVLISDFYPGYDAVACTQQKCWVHLIRDLNKDLLAAPFDTEFEVFLLGVRDMIIPIMEAVLEYGLKKRNLGKFKKNVKSFYRNQIDDRIYKSDIVLKYQKRFQKYRDSLFTFLDEDGIPWENNTAERAIRHIAKQRAISSSFSASVMKNYLVLLGIKQTCRFQGKSFFKFLLSKEINLDQFKAKGR